MSDMLWLKHFIDERIALAHRETSAAPNTAHGSVVVDRFGHVINGMAGSSGGASLFAVRNDVGYVEPLTITAGSDTIIDFSRGVYSFRGAEDNPIATGSEWAFTSAIDAVYHVTIVLGFSALLTNFSLLTVNLNATAGLPAFGPGGSAGVFDFADGTQKKYILAGSDDVYMQATWTLSAILYLSTTATIDGGYISIHRIGAVV